MIDPQTYSKVLEAVKPAPPYRIIVETDVVDVWVPEKDWIAFPLERTSEYRSDPEGTRFQIPMGLDVAVEVWMWCGPSVST